MRIAMYTDCFYPNINGVSTAVVNLAKTLAEAGHEIFIQAPRYPGEVDLSFLPEGIKVHYVKSVKAHLYPDFRIGSGLPLSLNAIRRFKPDIVHIHTPLSVGLEGTLIAKALGLPAVYTFHTYIDDVFNIFGVQNRQILQLVRRGGWQFNTTFCNRFASVIAPSQAVYRDLKSHHVNRPIFVAPNILEESVFAPKRNKKKKLTRLLYVGRLSAEKRIDLNLKVLAKLRETDPDYELILIGDGPDRHRLFDLSVKLGIAPAVTWYGAVDHKELIDQHLYHLGDIFLMSSRYETQGLSTLEAMAHGVPVVAVRSTASNEVIGEGGIIVPNWNDQERAVSALARAVTKLNEQPDKPYHQLAYQQAQKFSPQVLLETYTTIYQKVIES